MQSKKMSKHLYNWIERVEKVAVKSKLIKVAIIFPIFAMRMNELL